MDICFKIITEAYHEILDNAEVAQKRKTTRPRSVMASPPSVMPGYTDHFPTNEQLKNRKRNEKRNGK